MRKIATVFVIAVLAPTIGLALLAMRSLHDQEIVANSQRAILHQSSTEALAADLNTFMDDVRVFFRQLVNDLVEEAGPEVLSTQFDRIVPERWSQCSVACVVTDEGQILSPTPLTTDPASQDFLKRNAGFLLNQSDERFYEAKPVSNSGPIITENRILKPGFPAARKPAQPSVETGVPFSPGRAGEIVGLPAAKKKKDAGVYQLKVEVAEQKLQSNNPFRRMSQSRQNDLYLQEAVEGELEQEMASESQRFDRTAPMLRNVVPSQAVFGTRGVQQVENPNENWSRLEWGVGNLKEIVGGKTEGALSRFLQDGLQILLWNRHPEAPDRIFWVELDLDEIRSDLTKIVTGYSTNSEICLALLDGQGEVVAKTFPNFSTDWSHPFVASEVGQIMPHWEVAAYLLDPESVNRSAHTARLTIWLLVPTLLAAIAIGTSLIFRSIGLEMRLARQKTDFVSNVSHELKTPLTSIRMFSDLLTVEGASQKDREYCSIISREAARLTRLINNLLDFSRMERGENPYRSESIDLESLTRETVETYRIQLEAEGCRLSYESDPAISVRVTGDRDALAQVLLNLLSNAEKYGCPRGMIEVRLLVDEEAGTAEWQVLDNGNGIDRKHAARVFDKFFRVNDSLTNEIQGSGLGLSLAKQIVVHHGGRITFWNRPEGGCCFSVTLPVHREA